ncbi:hypothetical protein ACHAXS_008943 [Conticribra weissflogii]
MTSQTLPKKRPSPSQQELDQRAKEIQQTMDVHANEQVILENETQLLNRMLSTFKPKLEEFEMEEMRIKEMKRTHKEDGERIAKKKEEWNAELAKRVMVDKIAVLADEEAKKEHHDAIQLAKANIEAVSIAEQQWIVAAGALAKAESDLAECNEHLLTMKQRIGFQTRIVRSCEMRITGLKKAIGADCAVVIKKCAREGEMSGVYERRMP